ncbi:hypothetical protein U3516DRAFT_569855 [Neocallimastix sp. 'constans']
MSLVLGIFLGKKNDIENETDLETDKDAWPPKIVEYLENCLFPQYNEKAISTTESCTWVNILFARYFLELRNAKDFKERMKKKLNDKLSRKLKNISYIQSVELTDFNFGDVSPYFNGVRVKKSSSEKLEVLLIVLPYLKDPTLFGVTFINNPNPEFSIEVLSNKFKDKKKYFLTPVFSVLNKVLKSFFLEYWTLPAIRTFDLPLVAPKIPIYVYVSNDNKTNNVCAPQPIQSTKRHTNSQRSLDIILDKTFPIYTHVSSNNASLFNERLTSTFVYLAKENNNDIYKLLEKRQSIDQSPLAYEFWKTIKNKHGIHVQKKQMNEYGERGCIFKGTFVVRMNPKNAYNIITNMSNEASGYVFSDTFIRSSIIKRFNNDTLVRHLLFKLNRQQNHGYIVFEAHKKIEDDDENDILDQALSVDKTLMSNEGEENKNNKYVIVWRSIAGIKNEEIEENILQKENDNIPITDLHKGKLRSYTVNDSLDKEGRKISLNKPIYEMDQKTPILMENEKILLLKTDSFLKSKQSTSKEQSTLTSSFHSLNSLSLICKNETEPLMDILKKPIQLTDKMVQSPTVKPKEMSIKNENSFRNSSTDDKIYNNNISDINERRKKESLKINDNPSNNENSESKQSEALDLMVTSSKDYLMVMENYKINTKPVGMFKLSLSDDEELVSYDNNLNSNRTDSSTSSLTSLSEKYEDTASVILDNEFSLSTRKSNEKLDIELSDNEKTIGTSILESKVINTNDNKSNLYQTSKDANLTNIISNTDNDKSELFENINALYIKGFYLEPQLGDPESCYLTVISQYEPSFKKFEANYEYCRKLKKFLEDHNQIINNSSNTNSMEEDKRKSFTRSVSGENIAKLGKIKNYISNGLVKVVTKRGSIGDDRNTSKVEDEINSSMLLSDTCRSTDSVNTLDEDREREVHTKNNIVTLKHINKPNIPLYNQNFTNQFINNKETIRVESQHLGGETWNELRFEFNEAKNLPLDFSISFKPTILSMFDKWKHIYNESPTEPGVFMILPTFTCYTSQTLKIINGCLSIYDFPAGIFIYKWENNARKTPKHISFRFAIQPVTLLISPQNSLSQYCNEYNSVVSIKQRSCGKFFVRYIPLNEQCYKSIGISGRTAFLNYQIYTKGSDIQFGIIYESLQENSTQLPEIQSSLTMEASSNVRKKSNLNRKTSSLTNIPNEENYNSNENLTDEAKLKQISEVVSSSPKMEKYDSENQFIINDMHPNSTNIVKDNFELKPNQRFVIPISKCNSHKNVLNGTIPISNKFGTYTFIFNNSFSIVTSKTLELNIKLLIL